MNVRSKRRILQRRDIKGAFQDDASLPVLFHGHPVRALPTVVATSYQGSFNSGRTMPRVFACEDSNGNNVGEFVVKMRGSVETHEAGLLREILANLLANEFGISTPEPAIVRIEPELANAMTNTNVAEAVHASVGLNYGSINMTGGFSTWPVGKLVPLNLKADAADIFVFDALIQNPDRRTGRKEGKPNLLWKDDRLMVIDHEMAFSFLLSILPSPTPWLLNEQPYLSDHVFYSELSHADLDLSRITGAIEAIGDDFWQRADAAIPDAWKGSELLRIRTHVEKVQQHLDVFMNEIRRVLL